MYIRNSNFKTIIIDESAAQETAFHCQDCAGRGAHIPQNNKATCTCNSCHILEEKRDPFYFSGLMSSKQMIHTSRNMTIEYQSRKMVIESVTVR